MTYLPINLELRGRKCLIVGGGEVALRRAVTLIAHEADVTVVAPQAVPELASLADGGKLRWNQSVYASSFIDGMDIVVAATNMTEVNETAASDARDRGILVCRADRSSEGDFIFPAVLERGGLTISVTTKGGSPTLTAVLIDLLSEQYGPEWAEIVELCSAVRDGIKLNRHSADIRKAAIRRILADGEIRILLNDGKFIEAEARARQCLLSS
jgi:precorrin-2 dehydrogenase/sirohydrochlorin ferrochelatase